MAKCDADGCHSPATVFTAISTCVIQACRDHHLHFSVLGVPAFSISEIGMTNTDCVRRFETTVETTDFSETRRIVELVGSAIDGDMRKTRVIDIELVRNLAVMCSGEILTRIEKTTGSPLRKDMIWSDTKIRSLLAKIFSRKKGAIIDGNQQRLLINSRLESYFTVLQYQKIDILLNKMASFDPNFDLFEQTIDLCAVFDEERIGEIETFLLFSLQFLKNYNSTSKLIPKIHEKLIYSYKRQLSKEKSATLSNFDLLPQSITASELNSYTEALIFFSNVNVFRRANNTINAICEDLIESTLIREFQTRQTVLNLIHIGEYYKQAQNYRKSELCYSKAIKLAISIESDFELSTTIVYKLGKLYRKSKRFTAEKQLYSDFPPSIDSKPAALLLLRIGDVQYQCKQPALAEECYNKSILLLNSIELPSYSAAEALAKLAFLHLSDGRVEEAKEEYAKIRVIFDALQPDSVKARNRYKSLSQTVRDLALDLRAHSLIASVTAHNSNSTLLQHLTSLAEMCDDKIVFAIALETILRQPQSRGFTRSEESYVCVLLAEQNFLLMRLEDSSKWFLKALELTIAAQSSAESVIAVVRRLQKCYKLLDDRYHSEVVLRRTLAYCQRLNPNSIESVLIHQKLGNHLKRRSGKYRYIRRLTQL